MGGVINIVTSAAVAADGRAQAAVRQPQQPEARLLRAAIAGASSAWRSRAASSTPTASRSCAPIERGPIDNNANVDYQERQRQGRLRADRSRQRLRPRRLLHARTATTARSARSTTRSWTTVERRRARCGCPTTAICRRASSSTSQRAHFNFLAVTNAATTPEHRAPGDRSARADQRRRRHGAVDARRSARATSSAPAPTGAGWTATARRTRSTSRAGPSRLPPASRRRRRCRCSASRAARSRASARSCRTSSRRLPKLVLTLSARVDHWRNYDAHNLETTVATGLPTANNRPSLPDRDDTVVSPRAGALYHVDGRVSVWGESAPASARRRSTSCTASSGRRRA